MICKVCGGEMPRRNSTFCSKKCRDEFYAAPHKIICSACGEIEVVVGTRTICHPCENIRKAQKRREAKAHRPKAAAPAPVKKKGGSDCLDRYAKEDAENRAKFKHVSYGKWMAGKR